MGSPKSFGKPFLQSVHRVLPAFNERFFCYRHRVPHIRSFHKRTLMIGNSCRFFIAHISCLIDGFIILQKTYPVNRFMRIFFDFFSKIVLLTEEGRKSE